MIAYDYSAGPIAPSALNAAGVAAVVRYVSTPGESKNITGDEHTALAAAGITVALVYETEADWMRGGYGAGAAAAHAARTQANAVGYPGGRRIWYPADFKAAANQISTVLEALRGAAAAEGSNSLVAVYGDYDVCNAAVADGFGAPWQTDAWSSGRRCRAAVLHQTGRQTSCDDVQVDVNEVAGPLFPTDS